MLKMLFYALTRLYKRVLHGGSPLRPLGVAILLMFYIHSHVLSQRCLLFVLMFPSKELYNHPNPTCFYFRKPDLAADEKFLLKCSLLIAADKKLFFFRPRAFTETYDNAAQTHTQTNARARAHTPAASCDHCNQCDFTLNLVFLPINNSNTRAEDCSSPPATASGLFSPPFRLPLPAGLLSSPIDHIKSSALLGEAHFQFE